MNYANMIEEKNLKKTFILATLVSTIIGTFTTGINLYDRVGEKRKQNKKDSGQDAKIKELEQKITESEKKRDTHQRRAEELEGSLKQGGPVIRQTYNRDLARLGPKFAEGDAITHNQLQSQIITLQGTVIGLLEDALYTGRLENINKLYNASEFAREGSINALQAQYQRMLQAAPVRRPIGPIRRISSTPSVRSGPPKSIKARSEREDKALSRRAPTERAPTERAVTEVRVENDDRTVANSEIKETAALMAFDASGPLFCRYSVDLQETDMPLDICFSKGGSQACPLCGTRLGIEPGRVWKIEKEIVHEKISTPDYDDEVIEERTFLLGNRFIVKCHREKAGFSCVLCYRNRDRDTICESVSGLIRHIWQKHDAGEYESVQLCLESYYDNTIFHRIIKDFLVQGGDPTGTGTGGESIYGGVFADEFHSRLKFKHRGIVAMANAGSPHSNGSQFFITLDRCDWLDRKHTIFGKVTGDTMYNLLRLGEVETDKNDRPLDPPPKILSVEVLWNPFEDIVPRTLQKPQIKDTPDTDSKDSKKKGVKKLNLLSFGEEAEEEEKELALVKQKIKSSHDVLNDPRLLKEETPNNELSSSGGNSTRSVQLSVRDALNSKKEESQKDSEAGNLARLDSSDDDEADFDARMRMQILNKRKDLGDLPSKPKLQNGRSSSVDHDTLAARPNAVSVDDDQPRVEKLSLKKKGIGSDARAERMANADADFQLLNEAERGRQLQKQKKRRLQGREDDVLAKLEKFKNALSAKTTATTGESGDGNDEELSDWRGVRLKFAPGTGKDRMSRSDDPNDYVVHDPLLEKGKEKFNRMQAKQKRREREWAGRSLT